MAAILCRICFVEPCKAMAKCCEECCNCLGSCCECFGNCFSSCCKGFENCCDYISSLCDKPFSGCLFTSVSINIVALIYAIIAIISGGSQCDKPLLILAILLLACALINALFSYYMYRTINHDADNPLFNKNNDPNMSASSKLYEFFKYDKWMAAYIIFILILIALLSVSITMAGTCTSDIGRGVFWIAILLFIYLGIAILILFSYVAFDAFKEWAGICYCWLVPVCWPCLLIGCCLNVADDFDGKDKRNNNNTGYVAPSDQNQTKHTGPIIVVEQPPRQQPVVYAQQPPQQPVVYAQQPISTQQVVYTQPPQQMMVTQPQVIQQPMTQQQHAYNPNVAAPMQPGVFVAHGAPQQQQQQQQGAQAESKENEDYKDKSVQAAKAAGVQAKKAGVKALGWMTKKMNALNEKAQDDKSQGTGEGQEGRNTNKKAY